MEDYKWIIYVIAALYFIFRSRKKKSQSPEEGGSPSRPEAQPTGESSKPITFEDLLREIQQAKTPAPKQEAKPVVEEPLRFPKYEDYDDSIEKEEKDLEEVDYSYRDQDKIYETYEKAKRDAFNRPSLEETMDVKDTVVKFGHFKEYDKPEEHTMARTLAAELQNPEDFKRAFILSEVLKRRF